MRLADAIPDGVFDFIWFDACYMSGIETAYELRDKCDTFVAYPTEVYTPGMPYNLTIPYILKETPDLKSAASEFSLIIRIIRHRHIGWQQSRLWT